MAELFTFAIAARKGRLRLVDGQLAVERLPLPTQVGFTAVGTLINRHKRRKSFDYTKLRRQKGNKPVEVEPCRMM